LRTPFLVLISAFIVLRRSVLRNYAILPVKGQHRSGDLRKPHFGNVAGGKAETVERVLRVEVQHFLKVLTLEIVPGVQTQSCHHHICHAVGHGSLVEGGDGILVQFFKEAVPDAVMQVTGIVGQVVLHGVLRRREDGVCKAVLVPQLPEGAFKGFNYLRFVFRLHLPNGDGTGIAARMGVGNVEVVNEPLLFAVYILKDGNAGRSLVDPAPEGAVPAFDL